MLKLTDSGQFFPHQETQTANGHQSYEGQANNGVVVEQDETLAGSQGAEQIKACIAKRGDGMEDTPGQGPTETEPGPEPQEQNGGADALDGEASCKHQFLDPHHAVHIA